MPLETFDRPRHRQGTHGRKHDLDDARNKKRAIVALKSDPHTCFSLGARNLEEALT
jgi:hypothetical protein